MFLVVVLSLLAVKSVSVLFTFVVGMVLLESSDGCCWPGESRDAEVHDSNSDAYMETLLLAGSALFVFGVVLVR